MRSNLLSGCHPTGSIHGGSPALFSLRRRDAVLISAWCRKHTGLGLSPGHVETTTVQ